ncbi:MFS transporter [Bradyrhizobium sp. Ec3.3]|uniref:MFS transporter n=1 Tax=Bradyrhizobium sp. Ec3.3 TaxID=189753 RepID=UPI0004015BB2|nr:MFS transporter [Bradyrhizobium sp. Ec3.3]
MRNRWGVLAILFFVRLTMAFQFQSVAAVAPLLEKTFGVGLADIGLLIGLYFTPGVFLALPGGAIGARFGDKATALAALALMMSGSMTMALTDGWSSQIAGRLVAGIGGVLLSVQLTKMTTDWFAGKEIATAMGIVINSWPAGIALSLLTLPAIGTAGGAPAVFFAVCAVVAAGIVLISFTGRPQRAEQWRRRPLASIGRR